MRSVRANPGRYDYATHWLGSAYLTVENSGDIDVSARAEALASGPARVNATATGVWQAARGLNPI